MNDVKDSAVKEVFDLAIQNHQKNNLQDAQNYYQKVLEIDPNHADTHNNLGIIFQKLGEAQKAKSYFENAIEFNPDYTDAHFNLGNLFKELGEHQKAKDCYEQVIKIDPNYANAHNNLGAIFKELGKNQKAISYFEKAIELNPDYIDAHYNLGYLFKELGNLQKAKDCYERAIKINFNNANAHNNLGVIFQELGNLQKAKDCYEKAIEINPSFTEAYWNMHTMTSNIDEALAVLNKIYKIDNKYFKAKIMISAIEGFKGNFDHFNNLLSSPDSNHPYVRSIKWVFSLPRLSTIIFNRWNFFDTVIALSENSRPFYEFGVWNGDSFQYLIKTFKKGFGFDTFSGIPEDWHNEPKGTYSSFGAVPKIEGGEFIVGNFEDTLPDFFLKERPMASLINFDADLYSSTLCALNYSNKVIDEKTILVFDEFIMNDKWEEDEFKALNEFCSNSGFGYDVIAVSFSTKQVAVKLKKI